MSKEARKEAFEKLSEFLNEEPCDWWGRCKYCNHGEDHTDDCVWVQAQGAYNYLLQMEPKETFK